MEKFLKALQEMKKVIKAKHDFSDGLLKEIETSNLNVANIEDMRADVKGLLSILIGLTNLENETKELIERNKNAISNALKNMEKLGKERRDILRQSKEN